MENSIVIIGGGQAGSMAAISLRQQKYNGPITIVGGEDYLPYQRPPLSKGFLSGGVKEKNLYFKSLEYYKKNNINIIKNIMAIKIDRDKKIVFLEDGQILEYGTLIITTGSKLNILQHNSNKNNIFYLRTIDDSIKIKMALKQHQKIVIIGAGYIGLEVAAASIKNDLDVTVIETATKVMNRSICDETSDFIKNKHVNEGVKFIFDVSVVDIEDHNLKKKIICSNGFSIEADAVIIGIGIKPNIQLAEESGLDCGNGIIVNEYCKTSDPNIFSAGDCTDHPNIIYQQRMRLESVQNAVGQAKTVANVISGRKKLYDQVPWFWSDQYELKIKIAGISQKYDEYVIRGSLEDNKFAIFYLKNKQIIAVDSINDNKSFSIGRKLIRLKAKISKKNLQDKNANMKNWLEIASNNPH